MAIYRFIGVDPARDQEPSIAVVPIGNGFGALMTIAATNTKTTPAASAAGGVLLAANPARAAATITNNGTTALHIDPTGTGTIETVVQPGGSYSPPDGYKGAIEGSWDGSPTGSAAVSEISV